MQFIQFVICNPDVLPFSRKLSRVYHQFAVNRFYGEGRGEIKIKSVDGYDSDYKRRKIIYALIEEKGKDNYVYDINSDVL